MTAAFHDPLCEWSSLAPPLTPCNQCDLIARVREDERNKVWSEQDRLLRNRGWSIACLSNRCPECEGCWCAHHEQQPATRVDA